MDQLWKEVLREKRESIIQSADAENVFLNRLLDHLISKECIQQDQRELIMRKSSSRDRVGAMIDFLCSENERAFDELCNAIELFGNVAKQQLADSLRQSLMIKYEALGRRYKGICIQLFALCLTSNTV
jgi:Caspase recruitment domain